MKKWILLILVSAVVLQMPACLPVDEDIDPDDPITKFLGTWKVNETCVRLNYEVEIVPDPGNSAQVLINNFGSPGAGYDPAVGLVVTNSIFVSSQTIGTGWTINGKGTYQSNGTISWTYTLLINQVEYNCTAVYSR